MKFYLSSYMFGNEEYIPYLKKWIKENGNEVYFIDASRDCYEDSERKRNRIEIDKNALKEIGFEVYDLKLKDYFDKDLTEIFLKAKAFCVIGGNTFVLRKAMEKSGFDKLLLNNLKENKLYVAYSAGVCVLCNSLEGMDLVDEPINPYNDEPVIYEGLGVLDKKIVPHYKSNHKESGLVDIEVEYYEKNNIPYITMKDGDVIIKEF